MMTEGRPEAAATVALEIDTSVVEPARDERPQAGDAPGGRQMEPGRQRLEHRRAEMLRGAGRERVHESGGVVAEPRDPGRQGLARLAQDHEDPRRPVQAVEEPEPRGLGGAQHRRHVQRHDHEVGHGDAPEALADLVERDGHQSARLRRVAVRTILQQPFGVPQRRAVAHADDGHAMLRLAADRVDVDLADGLPDAAEVAPLGLRHGAHPPCRLSYRVRHHDAAGTARAVPPGRIPACPRYAFPAMTPRDGDARAWAALAPNVPDDWFVHPSRLHGVRHTQRVHVHAQRLTSELRWDDADTRLVLSAALWHDIGRTNDGEDPRHGAQSAARVLELGLPDAPDAGMTPAAEGAPVTTQALATAQALSTAPALATAEADIVLFAIVHHCLRDEDAREAVTWWHAARLRGATRRPGAARPADEARRLAQPERALRILWLLKDADALDRVRLQRWEEADPTMLRHPQTATLLPFADELYRITERAGR